MKKEKRIKWDNDVCVNKKHNKTWKDHHPSHFILMNPDSWGNYATQHKYYCPCSKQKEIEETFHYYLTLALTLTQRQTSSLQERSYQVY